MPPVGKVLVVTVRADAQIPAALGAVHRLLRLLRRAIPPPRIAEQQTLDYAVRDLRATIESLSGQGTSRLDMASVLRDAVAAVAPSATVAVRANCLLPGAVEDEIQRIVREAVANADRHAHAQTIDVSCWRDHEGVLVRVADDGRGFDPGEPARDNRSHFGLGTMRFRAALIGGRLSVSSRMQGGTLVELRWQGQAG